MAKGKQKKPKEKTFVLEFTEGEIKNHLIRRAMVELVTLKAGLQSTQDFIEISPAEAEIMAHVPLFTKLEAYKEGKYPKEVGKYKSQRVVLKE